MKAHPTKIHPDIIVLNTTEVFIETIKSNILAAIILNYLAQLMVYNRASH